MAFFAREHIVMSTMHALVIEEIGRILYKSEGSGRVWIEHRVLFEDADFFAMRNFCRRPSVTAFNKWMDYLVIDCGLLVKNEERDPTIPCHAFVTKYRAEYEVPDELQLQVDFSSLRSVLSDETEFEPHCVRCMRRLTNFSIWTCNWCNNWLQANHIPAEVVNFYPQRPDFEVPVGDGSVDILS
jgi:hypothetical protein